MTLTKHRHKKYTDEIVYVFDEDQTRVYFEVDTGGGVNGYLYPESLPKKDFYDQYTRY